MAPTIVAPHIGGYDLPVTPLGRPPQFTVPAMPMPSPSDEDPNWAIHEVVETPYYIKEVVDRPYFVDRTTHKHTSLQSERLSEVQLQLPINVTMRKVRPERHDRDFPYHDPIPSEGCDFIGHFLPFTSENPNFQKWSSRRLDA